MMQWSFNYHLNIIFNTVLTFQWYVFLRSHLEVEKRKKVLNPIKDSEIIQIKPHHRRTFSSPSVDTQTLDFMNTDWSLTTVNWKQAHIMNDVLKQKMANDAIIRWCPNKFRYDGTFLTTG